MENYTVHLDAKVDMVVNEDNPFDAYRKAHSFITDHLNDIFDNVSFSIADSSVTDESGNRVTAIVVVD